MEKSKEIVRTKNFIMAPNDLTGTQERLITAVQTKIKLNTEIEYVDFTLNEIGDIMNMTITNYERFRDLFRAVKTLELTKSDGKRITLSTLFSEITWDTQNGFIRFNFSNLAKENFIRIQGKTYASIETTISTFDSYYSIKIFQVVSLLKNMRKKEETYSMEKFRELLNITDKYADINNLRKRVFEVAKNEINEKTRLSMDYKLNKTGKYISSVTLSVKRDKVESFEMTPNNVSHAQKIDSICRNKYLFTPDQILEIILKYPHDLFFKVSYKIQNLKGTPGEIKNPYGYFWSEYNKSINEEKPTEKKALKEIEEFRKNNNPTLWDNK